MNIMIDLETMSVKNNAIIASVGACKFSNTKIVETFYRTVDLNSYIGKDNIITTELYYRLKNNTETVKLLNKNHLFLEILVNDFNKVCSSFSIDLDTIIWWIKKPKKTIGYLFNDTKPIFDVISDLNDWIRTTPVTTIWGNGATFDNIIIRNAFNSTNMTIPWRYWSDRCYRTVRNIYPRLNKHFKKGVKHNALDDAIYQAEYLIELCKLYDFEIK